MRLSSAAVSDLSVTRRVARNEVHNVDWPGISVSAGPRCTLASDPATTFEPASTTCTESSWRLVASATLGELDMATWL